MNANPLKTESLFSLFENEAKRFPSLKLFEAGKITPGQAPHITFMKQVKNEYVKNIIIRSA